jgi:hypothetical protein
MERRTWARLDGPIGSGATDERRVRLRSRLRGEYREMPGMCLKVDQAARLFGLDRAETEDILDSLVSDGFLRRTATGFVRDDEPH